MEKYSETRRLIQHTLDKLDELAPDLQENHKKHIHSLIEDVAAAAIQDFRRELVSMAGTAKMNIVGSRLQRESQAQ